MKLPALKIRLEHLVVFIALSFFACVVPSTRAQQNGAPLLDSRKWNYDGLKEAPEKARARRNPLANDPDAVQAGESSSSANARNATAKRRKEESGLRV